VPTAATDPRHGPAPQFWVSVGTRRVVVVRLRAADGVSTTLFDACDLWRAADGSVGPGPVDNLGITPLSMDCDGCQECPNGVQVPVINFLEQEMPQGRRTCDCTFAEPPAAHGGDGGLTVAEGDARALRRKLRWCGVHSFELVSSW